MTSHARPRLLAALLLVLDLAPGGPPSPCQGQEIASPARRPAETADLGDGRRVAGKIVDAMPAGTFGFAPDDGGEPIPLERVSEIAIDGSISDLTSGPAPFRVHLGADGRISGRLVRLDDSRIVLDAGPGAPPLAIQRSGVTSLVQRPGEGQVLAEGFESLDLSRWSQGGELDLVASPRLVGERALKLPAGGSSLTARLPTPLSSGRFELAYRDDGVRSPGHRWFVDLTFRKANSDLATIRVVGGWSEETLAVETPGGPALIVQPLVRKPGWHRLSIRFDDQRTTLVVDGDDLAHGHGFDGPLIEVRLASEVLAAGQRPEGLAVVLDDLRLVRFAEPSGRFEVEPSEDEVRLISGDQLFGRVRSADTNGITFRIDGRTLSPSWSEVAGLYFRRSSSPSSPISGQWVRVEWRTAPGDDARDLDFVEGALAGIDPSTIHLAVPYVGKLSVNRDRLRRIVVLPRMTRQVIDTHAHHLGDRMVMDLDPPQAEVAPVEYGFALEKVPATPTSLALDVVGVIGEEGNEQFSDLVKKGQLRTYVFLNGRRLDDLNTKVSKNDKPQRVRLAIPPDVLKAGRNVLRIEQTETDDERKQRDNFGILNIGLESVPIEAGKP
jgi:hypothetical protein